MGYTNTDRERIIKIAIREYQSAKTYYGADSDRARHAFNMMENVYNMVSSWSVKGTAELKALINKERSLCT